jgi:hypothetical protein
VWGHSSKAAPALTALNGKLYMTYIANNDSNTLLSISSYDGVTWANETVVAG